MDQINHSLPIREPTHPGEYIGEDILAEFGLTQQELADRLNVSRRTINELVNKRRGVSPDMALRLARLTGSTPEIWLRLQMVHDLWRARRDNDPTLLAIRPLVSPAPGSDAAPDRPAE
ncbi:MAG: Azospirillum phage Cd [Pseudomonadota bacterium]|jgi:addiction module HigA family antidote